MAVKFITKDGTIQPLLMGTVHAQLMRTACHGRESKQRFSLMYRQHTVESDGWFAMNAVHYLSWAVEKVGAKWQVNRTICLCYLAIQYGDVFLLDGVSLELGLQMMVNLHVFGHDEQSRRCHVQTMYGMQWHVLRHHLLQD